MLEARAARVMEGDYRTTMVKPTRDRRALISLIALPRGGG
jgi:hypothetical protein